MPILLSLAEVKDSSHEQADGIKTLLAWLLAIVDLLENAEDEWPGQMLAQEPGGLAHSGLEKGQRG